MINELTSLGLEHYEAKIVEALLKERLDIRELSDKAGVPFGKIYSIIKNLKEKDIVKETNSRPKLVYIENASELISRLIEEQQNKRNAVFDKLREFATVFDAEKNKETKFFEIGSNVEHNKKIQLRTFTEAKKEVLQIINVYHKPKSNRESKTLWEIEIEKAIKRGVIFKSIYPKETILPPILEKLSKKHPDKFQVKRFNTYFTRCDIIDQKKVLIKLVYEDALNFGGVLFIENERFAANLVKIFNDFWASAD